MNVRIFLITITFITLSSCSIPDLNDEDVLKTAKEEAIEISTLTKEFMFGMMWLYVDDKNETFTGWVKDTHPNQKLKSLGYLKNGHKQGLWINWYQDGKLQSKKGWKNDFLQGKFKYWYPNGKLKVKGQTKGREVDGVWRQFYRNGNKHHESINNVGKLVSHKIWKINGELCQESKVENGTGTFVLYDENGSQIKRVTFKDGIFSSESVP
jgi:antitoxin component YwqK of YwqJK toxin-antitoxin module